MTIQSVFSLLTLSFTLATLNIPTYAAPPREAIDTLTHDLAIYRKSQIASVAYRVSLNFEKDATEFSGDVLMTLNLNIIDAALSVDTTAKKVSTLKVNGQVINDYRMQSGSLEIPAKYLSASMTLEISYLADFGGNGQGIQRVVDPVDHEAYIYTDFEPYGAHGLFPMFDQPNLKAKFSLQVLAPKDWKAISNSTLSDSRELNGKLLSKFSETLPLSTYLYFVGVGPFVKWESMAGNIPMGLYARKSLASHVDFDEIFEITRKGLAFYQDFFATPYPFPKYDQIFAPNLDPGAMENAGAVTLNEKMIFMGAATQSARDSRSDTILHEMAHMWFGDLVTMNWWNDLWLNESFATYMASLAQERALQLPKERVWIGFFSDKTWGYWQDSLVTTHPIETTVENTDVAMADFDGITYAKGSATLKQLHYFVGETSFRQGVRNYFKTFAFQNSTRADFISSIANTSGVNLDGWTKTWLQTSGPNKVRVEWNCTDQKISSFKIRQSPSVSGVLAPHQTQIGFYRSDSTGTLALEKVESVAYSKAETPVPQVLGQACPEFVYPNQDDMDYAIFSLDPISLKAAQKNLASLGDPLLRSMIWNTLYTMVRNGEVKPLDFMKMAIPAMKAESNPTVLAELMSKYGSLLPVYFGYLNPAERKSLTADLENMAWAAVSGSFMQLGYYEFLLSIASTPPTLDRLFRELSGNETIAGLTLDQPLRWSLLQALARNGYAASLAMIETEKKLDPSQLGEKQAFAALVSIPDLGPKTQAWHQLTDKLDENPSWLQSGAAAFHNGDRPDLSLPFVDLFFQRVATIDWQESVHLTKIYFGDLFPASICSQNLLDQSESNLARMSTKLPDPVKRAWLEANDELGRCVKIRSP